MVDYDQFLQEKAQISTGSGFAPLWMPEFLFDFQSHIVDWSLRKGRSAVFADCGLGKTLIELVWAENVVRHSRKPVLLLAPLAVTHQIQAEADRFGINARISRDGTPHMGITITNYQRLHMFKPTDFAGIVCDESSILKGFNGATRAAITVFARKMEFRLLATATAAPNDYIELGTSSEALGYFGHTDMLTKFFKNDMNNVAQGRHAGQTIKWRLKGHAELPFWRWVCSWSIAIRRPSDIGYDDAQFKLPPLNESEHVVISESLPDGFLFQVPAIGLKEQRQESRRTIGERCEMAAGLVNKRPDASIAWCHLNDEGDLLEELIPDAVQVSGKDSDDMKEQKLMSFAKGNERVLVTKPAIGAWGLNYQHCNHQTMFPSHSFEQYYQCVRRSWRFGQKRPVYIDIVATDGGMDVLKNLKRKSEKADAMFTNLVAEMNNAAGLSRINPFKNKTEMPSWL